MNTGDSVKPTGDSNPRPHHYERDLGLEPGSALRDGDALAWTSDTSGAAQLLAQSAGASFVTFDGEYRGTGRVAWIDADGDNYVAAIEDYITDLYGPGVGRDTVSRVTAAVLEDAKAWRQRPLEAI